MAVAQRLDLRQSQQLVMTPQLQQAIKMLQMSNLELRDYIGQELERNPFLETAGEDRAPDGERGGDGEREAPSASDRLETTLADDRLSRADEVFDTGAENIYADEAVADRAGPSDGPALDGPSGPGAIEASAWASVGKGGGVRFEDEDGSLEGRIAQSVTLRDHLLEQLGRAARSAPLRLVAAALIESLDDAGYLRVDLDETADRLGASRALVDEAASLIRSLEPTGVGAVDLRQCLALQLAERDRLDPAMATMLDHLPLVAGREFEKLRKLCGVDLEDLRDMVMELRALDPKPGHRFQRDVVQYASPDVFVYENRAGGWSIELNTETLPRLLVNHSYASEVLGVAKKGPDAAEIREYVSELQQSANWLVKSIDQRARTILRVSTEIVRQQDGFFAYGVSGLRPLNLKTVADAIEMHESTVSRVTSNKYVATPRGVFELKYFFTPAIAATDGGAAYSAEAIRYRIKALIDAETRENVLSDDRIVSMLRGEGVDIARRTVTKYREALSIPSSIQRRKVLSSMTFS